MKKRIATAILTLAMLCTMLPTALAAERPSLWTRRSISPAKP